MFSKPVLPENNIILSDQDAEIIEKALENPPEPNEALKRAMKTHKELIKDET